MDKYNLIIFKFEIFYEILKELEENINFNISDVEDIEVLNKLAVNSKNYLVVSKKKLDNIENQFILDKAPIKISKLIEKLNVNFLRLQFSTNSDLNIKGYKLNLNSRELIKNNLLLKLTEKEANIIIYLSDSKKIVDIKQLQSKVWGYNSKLETHTVETHIYRLRKKILECFKDKNFIISKKNGYEIN